jgi:long-chain acyl-CoA synthetase
MKSSGTVSDLFDGLWAREGDRIAIREDGHDITFRELLRWSQSISRELRPFVRQPGQRVALMLPNSAAFVSVFFGIARVGVAAPLSTHYRSQELTHYLGDLEATAFVVDPKFVQLAVDSISSLTVKPALIEVSLERGVHVIRSSDGSGRSLPYVGSPPLFQQYTSGSTGVPKRVVRTHDALLHELEALQKVLHIREDDRFLGVAPFSHVNGLVRTMMTSMYVGARLYPMAEFRRREMLNLMTSERVTFFGGLPQMFAILSQTPLRGAVDLSSLRVVFSSSAPLTVVDNRRFQACYGVFVRQLYGSTETGTISFNCHESPERSLQSVGIPLDGVRVEILDAAGNSLPSNHEGEIAIASLFAASGYLDNPAATKKSFRDNFYFPGDLGFKDEAGQITITGRKKIIINRGGFKVNPYEVEEVIREHPKVADVVVFGLPGPHGDDVVCCLIVPSKDCTVDEIIFYCRERIADFKIPTRIEFRDGLPTSSTGKILRANLHAGISEA